MTLLYILWCVLSAKIGLDCILKKVGFQTGGAPSEGCFQRYGALSEGGFQTEGALSEGGFQAERASSKGSFQ